MEDGLFYSVEDHEGIKIVHLSGNISNTTKGDFELFIKDLTQRNNVILTMKDVHIVTTSGLNTLVDVCVDARSKNKRILLLQSNRDLIRMIEILNLYEYFIFVDSFEEGKIKLKLYT